MGFQDKTMKILHRTSIFSTINKKEIIFNILIGFKNTFKLSELYTIFLVNLNITFSCTFNIERLNSVFFWVSKCKSWSGYGSLKVSQSSSNVPNYFQHRRVWYLDHYRQFHSSEWLLSHYTKYLSDLMLQ